MAPGLSAPRKLSTSPATVNVDSRGLVPTNLPLFSHLLQLPIPIRMDLRLTPGVHVLRRDVTDRTVKAEVVAMLDVASMRRRAWLNVSVTLSARS